jgi:hypothetical protein
MTDADPDPDPPDPSTAYLGDSSLLNPTTGLTHRHERFLAMLMEWTLERSFIRIVLDKKLSTATALKALAVAIHETVEGNRDPQQMMTERDCAVAILHFLDDRDVRTTIARFTSSALRDEFSKHQVVKDLYSLRQSIREHYRLAEGEKLLPKSAIIDPTAGNA